MEDSGILNPINEADLFVLHYVFIPRINACIQQFVSAWNHHPLRTERGLSPLQLWQRGMISASPHWQEEILSGFSVPPDYGVEDCRHLFGSGFDQGSVVIPRINISLTTQQFVLLQDMYSPLEHSDEGRMDIFVYVRQYIFNVLGV